VLAGRVGALPIELRQALGLATGFEPATTRLRGDNRSASTRTHPTRFCCLLGCGCGRSFPGMVVFKAITRNGRPAS
jgi:hypothetical protein